MNKGNNGNFSANGETLKYNRTVVMNFNQYELVWMVVEMYLYARQHNLS